MRVQLRGIAKVTAKGQTYYYAWRGGPRLSGEPGSPEFIASYNEAVASRRTPDTGRFKSIVTLYKACRDYRKLADTTRPVIRRWRNKWADKPRTADYGMQVLSRVLSYAVDPLGSLAANPCEGIKQLYSSDRSEIIWTETDIAAVKTACSPEDRACG